MAKTECSSKEPSISQMAVTTEIETSMNSSIMLTNLNSEQIGGINTVGVNGMGDTAAQP